jgi:hypothetical protein
MSKRIATKPVNAEKLAENLTVAFATAQDVADVLGVSVTRVNYLISRGLLPSKMYRDGIMMPAKSAYTLAIAYLRPDFPTTETFGGIVNPAAKITPEQFAAARELRDLANKLDRAGNLVTRQMIARRNELMRAFEFESR